MKKKLKDSFKLKLFILLMCTIITSSAVTYGFFYAGKIQKDDNTLSTTCFNVDFKDGKSIELENAASMSDASGQRTEPYNFSITNTCEVETSYQVVLNIKANSIAPKFLNYSLNNEIAENLASAKENPNSIASEEYTTSFILKTGSLAYGETASYNFRIWINASTTYEDVKGQTWEGEIQIITSVKELEDLKNPINRIKKSASENAPVFASTATTSEGVFKTSDNDGETYYYRGDVKNNYMKFADLYWRIVRVNGDGSLRLIYDGTEIHQNGTISEDRSIRVSSIQDNNISNLLNNWYTEKLSAYDKYIANGTYCSDPVENAEQPKLVCTNVVRNKIGLLDANEIIFAGATKVEENKMFYLNRGIDMWTNTSGYMLNVNGTLTETAITSSYALVPVINISSEYTDGIQGSGLSSDPYTL